MLDKSLIICYSTPNYEKLTTIFLDSLKKAGVPDTNIRHKLDILEPEAMMQTGFRTNLWYHCLIQKLLHLIQTLQIENTHTYYISSDCDINFIDNKENWNELEEYIRTEKRDIYFMREGDTNDVNGGFYIITNKDAVLPFLCEVLHEMITLTKDEMYLGDQTIINKKKDVLNYGRILNDYSIFGTKIYNKKKALFHHAIDCKDVDDKITQIMYVKLLLINES